MMQPKKTKFRKAHKGRIHGTATSGATLSFGQFGLKAVEPDRVTARQIEAGRSPHGLRQGLARIVGGPDQAGPRDVRDRRRAGRDRQGSAGAGCRQAADQDALRRAHRGVMDMAQMKVEDIRAMSPDQMEDAVLNLKKERFNLRFQRATGELENTSRLKEARRDIARIKTIAAQQRAKKK